MPFRQVVSVSLVVSYCEDTCLGPECAVDRRTIDVVVLVVRAVVEKQRVGPVAKCLRKVA